MQDGEFLRWFADKGHKWCGAPTWNKGEHGKCWNIAWHSYLGSGEWSIGYGVEPNRYHDHYATDHEAVCLIREHLRVQLVQDAGLLPWPFGDKWVLAQCDLNQTIVLPNMTFLNSYNAALVAAVGMKRKEKP